MLLTLRPGVICINILQKYSIPFDRNESKKVAIFKMQWEIEHVYWIKFYNLKKMILLNIKLEHGSSS